MRRPAPAGFLNLNKPLNMTSHDVVAAIRRRCRDSSGKMKVGHAGTLDPLADGVLIICLGAATRLSEYMMRSRKVYRAQVAFGASTDTYDAEGAVVARRDPSQLKLDDIRAALPQFIGEIRQVPPMYSAVKVKGKKLYELARAGKTIARAERAVTVHSIEVISWDSPRLALEIQCGAGTYIRSLANDLGEALEVGAYLAGLTRIASGAFRLDESITLDAALGDEDWTRHIVSPYDALADKARVALAADDIERVQQGQMIDRPSGVQAATVFAFDADQQLAAVLEALDDAWKPHKVFPRRS
ncbi:MAG: tRNA pseudouridine(55) synthase TruB [Chloroflexi bacterium]|nr:tRNA pseudouridine(55) synthase TruB [Chloroflexota bacterium]